MYLYVRDGATLDEVIGSLLGTCSSLNHDEFTPQELDELESELIECSGCGWWWSAEDCEPSEYYAGFACHDCIEELDYED